MQIKIPIEIIELDPDSYHLLIQVQLGKVNVNMVVDTGASKSVFSEDLDASLYAVSDEVNEKEFQSAGISEGELNAENIIIKKFKIGGQTIKDLKAVLINIDHINEIYAIQFKKEIFGLLGSDFLYKYNGVIDYKNRFLSFEWNK